MGAVHGKAICREKSILTQTSFAILGKHLKMRPCPMNSGKICWSPLLVPSRSSHNSRRREGTSPCPDTWIRNWLNPERAGMLPWPDDVLLSIGFGRPMREDDFTQRMGKAFNVCLEATSVESLREEAHRVRDMLDQKKLGTAQDFGRLLEAARRESPKGDWFSEPWYRGSQEGQTQTRGQAPLSPLRIPSAHIASLSGSSWQPL